MSEIYLLIEGQQAGPYTEEQVRQSLASEEIPGDLPAWHEGLTSWATVAEITSYASGEPTSVQEDIASTSPLQVPAATPVAGKSKLFLWVVVGLALLGGLSALGHWIWATRLFDLLRYTPESYIRVIVQDMKSQGGVNATDAHYTIQKTLDSAAPLLCEIDYTISAETGTSDQGILPSNMAIPVQFKAYLSFTREGWKFSRLTDDDDHELPWNNPVIADMVDFFQSETGYRFFLRNGSSSTYAFAPSFPKDTAESPRPSNNLLFVVRLGSTEDEVVQALGSASYASPDALSIGDKTVDFRNDDWVVSVTFYHGVVQCQNFRKTDVSAVSDADVSRILDADKSGIGWEKENDLPYQWQQASKMWLRNDKKEFAALSSIGELWIVDVAYQGAYASTNRAQNNQ